MKKILEHYLAGGTLVSPEGHTLSQKEFKMNFGDLNTGVKQVRQSELQELAMFDWQIQREPGIYRAAEGIGFGEEVYLVRFNGLTWSDPVTLTTRPDPNIIIERVEAEVKHPPELAVDMDLLEEAYARGASGENVNSFVKWLESKRIRK